MMISHKARELLIKIAHDCQDSAISSRIMYVVDELMHKREPAKPRARVKQEKITSSMVEAILAAHKENPHLHNRDLGRHYGIDGGRVSDILQGDRTVEFPEGTPEFRARYK